MAAYANEEEIMKVKIQAGQGGGGAASNKREIIMPGGYRGTK